MAFQSEQTSHEPVIRSPRPDATTALGRFPDFLVIGGMKCGSTTLYDQLARHPDLFLSHPKEPQFFSRDHVFEQGLGWYRSLFQEAGRRVCGEASTCYSRAPHFGEVAKRIHSHLPDVRLVYLVRHPVDRAYSHYRHEAQVRMIDGNLSVPTFEEMLEETDEIVDTSDYWRQLQEYLVHYPRERIHVLRLEDLETQASAVLDDLYRFLGVRVLHAPLPVATHSNEFGDKLARNEMHELVSTIRGSVGLQSAIDCLPLSIRAWLRSQLTHPRLARRILSHRVRASRSSLLPMRSETRKLLLRRFADSNRALESFLGVPLEGWGA